jgi:agmatine deiminase
MQWPHGSEVGNRDDFCRIITVLQGYEPVHIIAISESARTDAEHYLITRGVPLANITWHVADYTYNWMRDNGPVYAVDGNGLFIQDWGFDGWGWGDGYDDDDIPRHVTGWLGMRCDSYTLINERGTLEFNGADALVSSWSVLHARNPGVSKGAMEQLFKDAFGVTRVVWLLHGPSDDMTGGHVDGIARFISRDTVVVARYVDQGDPDAWVYEEAAGIIRDAGFGVVRMDIPGSVNYRGVPMAASYMNWLVANGVVVMTGFGVPEWDDAARLTVGGFFPGRDVAIVPTLELWYNGGGVHCVTNDQPAASVEPPAPDPPPSPMPRNLTITLSSDAVSPGSRIGIGAHVAAIKEPFDAWAVVLGPRGEVYSLRLAAGPVKGATALATSVPGLAEGRAVTLLDATVPHGMPSGGYTVAAALFPPGVAPRNMEDAGSEAIEGYFDQGVVTVNQ